MPIRNTINFSKVLIAFAMLYSLLNMSAASAEENVYNLDIKPLTIADCASCHISHFNRLKGNGAKHQGVTCTACHEQFHVYNPVKNNYAQIMPQCTQCHEAPHGTAAPVVKCLTCHADPHQPLNSLPTPANLETICKVCHAKVGESLVKFPSKHTKQPCSSCHSQKHGRIPVCTECHESHSPAVALQLADCLTCHPVHTPLQITYPVTQNSQVCGGCHEEPLKQLQAKQTKHSALTCAKCHPKHAQLMACQECHGQTPHSSSIHVKFPQCASCHGIAHNIQK